MSSPARAVSSILSIDDLSTQKIHNLIQLALRLKNNSASFVFSEQKKIVLLAFFEPSTRTRVSFEMAAHRLGAKPVNFIADGMTSVAKGESLTETLENLMAMRPDALVVRHAGDAELQNLIKKSKIPVINAGDGMSEHPSQALLDAMTVFEKKGKIEGEKILYVGDVVRSRVARSGIKIFSKLGAQVGCCSSAADLAHVHGVDESYKFTDMAKATQWCSVLNGLRIQTERKVGFGSESLEQSYLNYRVDKNNIKNLNASAIIMHPGPFVPDVDMTNEILSDSRCVVYDQVTNGIYMRMAMLGDVLGLSNS